MELARSTLVITHKARSIWSWILRGSSLLPCIGWRLLPYFLQHRALAVRDFEFFEGPAISRVFFYSSFHIGNNTQRSQHMNLNPSRLQPTPVFCLGFNPDCSQRRALAVHDFEFLEGLAISRVFVYSSLHIGYNTQRSQYMNLSPPRLQPTPVFRLALHSILFTAQSACSSWFWVFRGPSHLPCICLQFFPHKL